MKTLLATIGAFVLAVHLLAMLGLFDLYVGINSQQECKPTNQPKE
jgi:hypothetical protein